MARYDIVIPHWGTEGLTDICRLCLDSVADAGGDFRLILVDNGSEDAGRLQPQLDRMDHVVIRNSENLGFIRATNQGMQFSTAPFVVLLNNDTLVPPGWLTALEEPFQNVATAGLSGPLSDATGSWQGQWKKRNGGGVVTLAIGTMLAFFCTMIRRDVIDEVGYLDESYGVGFGDDDEYCRRAQEAGFRLCLCQDLKVSHRHRTSFQVRYTPEEIARMQADAMRRFRLSKGVFNGDCPKF
jgi:GT2 family glycosyltransferase